MLPPLLLKKDPELSSNGLGEVEDGEDEEVVVLSEVNCPF
jgi:hypothetical protein